MRRKRAIRGATLIGVAVLGMSGGFTSGACGQQTAAAMQTRVYLGMWTTHLGDIRGGVNGNSLLGVAYRGFFGATFINSYGDRGISTGIQRTFTRLRSGSFRTALSYRVGLVTGYDERFLSIAGRVPAVPFAQLVGSADHRQLGVELAYAGLIVCIALNWRL